MSGSAGHRIFTVTLASVYPLYFAKVEKKGRSRDELDVVIRWLTGYDQSELDRHLAVGTTFADFFAGARLHHNAALITGVVCGVLERRDGVAVTLTSMPTRVPPGLGPRTKPDHEGPV